MSQYITNYTDEYGNTDYGKVVFLGNKCNNNTIEIISPISFKNKWSSIDNTIVTETNISNSIRVGFYSTNTHYNILNQLGKTENLIPSAIRYLEESDKYSDMNINTWYSNGDYIKNNINDTQLLLF